MKLGIASMRIRNERKLFLKRKQKTLRRQKNASSHEKNSMFLSSRGNSKQEILSGLSNQRSKRRLIVEIFRQRHMRMSSQNLIKIKCHLQRLLYLTLFLIRKHFHFPTQPSRSILISKSLEIISLLILADLSMDLSRGRYFSFFFLGVLSSMPFFFREIYINIFIHLRLCNDFMQISRFLLISFLQILILYISLHEFSVHQYEKISFFSIETDQRGFIRSKKSRKNQYDFEEKLRHFQILSQRKISHSINECRIRSKKLNIFSRNEWKWGFENLFSFDLIDHKNSYFPMQRRFDLLLLHEKHLSSVDDL